MNDLSPLRLVLAAPAGIALGLFYFGGLWWTVRGLHRSARPGLLLVASFVVRLGLVAAALYFLVRDQWQAAPVFLVGFVATRSFLVRRWRSEPGEATLRPPSDSPSDAVR